MAAMMNASSAPTARPNASPARSEWTFRANQPIAAPAITPFSVEPMTMPTIEGATSGAEMRALKPSKIPSTPPSTIPSSGLLIGLPSPSCGPRNQRPHDDVGDDDQDRHAIHTRQA